MALDLSLLEWSLVSPEFSRITLDRSSRSVCCLFLKVLSFFKNPSISYGFISISNDIRIISNALERVTKNASINTNVTRLILCVFCLDIQLIQGREWLIYLIPFEYYLKACGTSCVLEFTQSYPYIMLAGNLNKSLVCNDIIGRKAQDVSKKGLPTNIRTINQSY